MTHLFGSRSTLKAFFCVWLVHTVISTTAFATTLPPQAKPEKGKGFYLRHNIWVDRGRSRATNYRQGKLVPFNTRVTLLSIGSKKIKLEIEDREVTVVNVMQHTRRTVDQIAMQLLSDTEVPLEGVPMDTRLSMQSGVMRLGMTKDQVILTRGYPPRHKTDSINADTWIYLTNRFEEQVIVFEGDKLVGGQELY